MKNYLNLLHDIMEEGEDYGNRTAYTRRSLSHGQRSLHFDLRKGIPLCAESATNTKAIFDELAWFGRGETNIKTLNSKIWNQWADENGDTGHMYGACFRAWNGSLDQLRKVVDDIKKYPNASDLVMTTWNPETVPDRELTFAENVKAGRQVLANCHGTVIQFFVRNGYLDMTTYQRSADMPVGVRFNLPSYALFQFLIAQECGLKIRYMDYVFGDAHIYHNQFEGVRELLSRVQNNDPVHLQIPEDATIFDFDPKEIKVLGYKPQPAINFGDIAV